MSKVLKHVAQATLVINRIAFTEQRDRLKSRLSEAREVWRETGYSLDIIDWNKMVDGQFVKKSSDNSELHSSAAPVNDSFLLTSHFVPPALSKEDEQKLQPIVELPITKIDFESNSSRLTITATEDLKKHIFPKLLDSRLYLKIEGSAAKPGIGNYTDEQVAEFALQRADSVRTFLITHGINPERLIIGSLKPEHRNSTNEAELEQDRFVRFTLVRPQGK